MAQRGQQARFPPETGLSRFVFQQMVRHRFDRHHPVEPAVVAFIHHAHPAATDDLRDLEGADLVADQVGFTRSVLELTGIRLPQGIE